MEEGWPRIGARVASLAVLSTARCMLCQRWAKAWVISCAMNSASRSASCAHLCIAATAWGRCRALSLWSDVCMCAHAAQQHVQRRPGQTARQGLGRQMGWGQAATDGVRLPAVSGQRHWTSTSRAGQPRTVEVTCMDMAERMQEAGSCWYVTRSDTHQRPDGGPRHAPPELLLPHS